MTSNSRVALVAMLIALLTGCVATPTHFRAPIGDFVTNIGSSTAPPSIAGAPYANSV